jgi:hypothetical protein
MTDDEIMFRDYSMARNMEQDEREYRKEGDFGG